MPQDKTYCIDGYRFANKTDYECAVKEYENINALKEKLNADDINYLKTVYHKLIEKRYLRTPVGMDFLREMKKYLEETTGEAMPEIPVPHIIRKNKEEDQTSKIQSLRNENGKLRKVKNILTISVIAFAAVIIGMFFIAATNDNAKYLNYENKVLDKYSSWEEELKSKEKELKDLEEKLSNDLD